MWNALHDYAERGFKFDRATQLWTTADGNIIACDRELTNRLGLWLGGHRFEPYLKLFREWELPLPLSRSLLTGSAIHYHLHKRLLTLATLLCQELSEEIGTEQFCPVNLNPELLGMELCYVEAIVRGVKHRHHVVIEKGLVPHHLFVCKNETRVGVNPLASTFESVEIVENSNRYVDLHTQNLKQDWLVHLVHAPHDVTTSFPSWLRQLQEKAQH